MANRSMQAKMLKHRKAKRRFPIRYSADYISVGMPPNRQVMREHKDRNKSLAFDQKFLDFLDQHTRFRGVPPGRVEARSAAGKIVDEAKMSVVDKIRNELPQLLFFSLPNMDPMVHKASVFFNSEKTCYVLMYENFAKGYVRRSITYDSKERILDRWSCDLICWAEKKSKSPSPPSV